jgi:hypothetical protein
MLDKTGQRQPLVEQRSDDLAETLGSCMGRLGLRGVLPEAIDGL